MTTWHPDFLDGYEVRDLPLPGVEPAPGEPEDVELVATLVRRLPANESRRAVLYVHGWNDYFFQTHLADHLADLGFDFYALDLRRYGRSLRRGHFNGFITDLDEYAVELDAATDVIAEDHDELLLMGHSTGGLIAALWAAEHSDRISGLVLNSPWLDLQGSAIVRTLGTPVIDALGSRRPRRCCGSRHRPLRADGARQPGGGVGLRPGAQADARSAGPGGLVAGNPLGHQRVAAGLNIEVPVLVLASTATEFARKWHEGLRTVDVVLDVEQIAARAVKLGPHVTVVRIAEGMHDLVLSAAHVRKIALDEIGRFVEGYVKSTPTLLEDGVDSL